MRTGILLAADNDLFMQVLNQMDDMIIDIIDVERNSKIPLTSEGVKDSIVIRYRSKGRPEGELSISEAAAHVLIDKLNNTLHIDKK